MKKNAFFSLLLLLLATVGLAQNPVTVSGLVTLLSNNAPVPNQQVFCMAGDSINPVFADAFTNVDGTYSVNMVLPSGFSEVYVATFSNCDPNGGFANVVAPVVNGEAHADFQVCDDSFPPFSDCFAEFYLYPVDSLTFQFIGYYYSFFDSTQAVSYLWDFGDGTTSTEESPVHTYAQGGFYTVTLTIVGQNGCVATVQYPFDTNFNGFPDCMGYIMYNQTGTTSFDFSAELYDANGNIVPAASYDWDFGDGNTSSDPAPSHTYANEGVYTVQLHAITDSGCEIHSCDVVFAYDCQVDTFWYGCQALFYVGFSGDSLNPAGPPLDPLTLNFYDASLGGVLTWHWDFGDSTTSTLQNPTHTYADSGVYTVTLAITTIDGCESEVSFEICVGNNCFGDPEFDCQALFIPLPDSSSNGIQFIDLSFVPDPSIQAWLWNFGDGTTSTEQNPYHVYAQPGIYTVTLTIESFMCNSTISFDIDTENPWNFSSNGGGPAKLGVAPGSVSTQEKFVFEGVKLFPNPAQTNLSVAFNSRIATGYELRISDLTGKTISLSQLEANVGLNTARANVANLVPGLYLAEIRSGETLQSIKFVKQ